MKKTIMAIMVAAFFTSMLTVPGYSQNLHSLNVSLDEYTGLKKITVKDFPSKLQKSKEKLTWPELIDEKPTWSGTRLFANDGEPGDQLGGSVSMSGDYLIAGAYGDSDHEYLSGAAYIFKRTENGWSQKQKLYASDPGYWNLFGISVSISGNYAIVGANGNDAAYIFEKNGDSWQQVQKLSTNDDSFFGFHVLISGNTALVGAIKDDENGTDAGAVYVFEQKPDGTWPTIATQKLLDSDGQSFNSFGDSISVSDNYMIIGARGNNGYDGAAYIFKKGSNGWEEECKLLPKISGQDGCFGYTVSLSGNYAIAGEEGTKSVHVYKRDNNSWNETATLTNNEPSVNNFGHSACISNSANYIIVGAFDYNNYNMQQNAYIFEQIDDDWQQTAKFLGGSAGGGIALATSSVFISENYSIFGNWENDGETGFVDVYKKGSTTYYVATDGDDNNDGLTHETAFATIQHALDIIDGGDVIQVLPGTYYEAMTVSSDVGSCTLLGSSDNPSETIISKTGLSVPAGLSIFSAEIEDTYFILDGFTIQNFNEPAILAQGATGTSYARTVDLKNLVVQNISSDTSVIQWTDWLDTTNDYSMQLKNVVVKDNYSKWATVLFHGVNDIDLDNVKVINNEKNETMIGRVLEL